MDNYPSFLATRKTNIEVILFCDLICLSKRCVYNQVA